ncbi:MAG: endonuclease/exonuclease/phosphatase family protein [Desulfosalsimonas sp.]
MMKLLTKFAIYAALAAAALYGILLAVAWLLSFHPPEVKQETPACTGPAPGLQPGRTVKVLSWNVQYMAGKDYHFFYEGGTDKRPSESAIRRTTEKIAQVIAEEDPDIILLQEVDHGARRTDYRNQIADLLEALPEKWPCRASAWYWKAGFVPHPDIMGAVGMKLVTLSKYRIKQATRHQLPLLDEGPVRRQFNLKRAVLDSRLPVEGGPDFAALNTHLSAFARESKTMKKQVAEVKKILDRLSEKQIPWVAGGDFNLLPPTEAYRRLPPEERSFYRPETEIRPLFEAYKAVPGLKELEREDPSDWYTHLPNRPSVDRPNKTIDYIFYPDSVALGKHRVRQENTRKLSDHLPVIAEFKLPEGRRK